MTKFEILIEKTNQIVSRRHKLPKAKDIRGVRRKRTEPVKEDERVQFMGCQRHSLDNNNLSAIFEERLSNGVSNRVEISVELLMHDWRSDIMREMVKKMK